MAIRARSSPRARYCGARRWIRPFPKPSRLGNILRKDNRMYGRVQMKTKSVGRIVGLTCAGFLVGLAPVRADEVIVGALETAPVGGIHAPAPQKIKLSAVKP